MMMDMNAKIREIQRQAMAMSTMSWQPDQAGTDQANDPMSKAFADILSKTKLDIDPGLELPTELKQVILALLNGQPLDNLDQVIKGIEEWAHHMVSSPSVTLNPFNQLTASSSYKMLAMALVQLVKQQQSPHALDALTRLCSDKKMLPADARWTIEQLTAIDQSLKKESSKWQTKEGKASLAALNRLVSPGTTLNTPTGIA